MSQNDIIKKAEYLQELESYMDEIRAEADTVRDSLKAEMMERGIEEMEAGKYIIRWTPVLSNRFDTTGFKKIYGDLYKAFTKQTASRRFSISC
jgi:predicted phage-related endonuclease